MAQNPITAPFYAPNLSTSLFQEYPSVFQDKTFGMFNRAVTQPFVDAFDLLGRTYETGKRGIASGIGLLSDNPRLTRDIYGLLTAGETMAGVAPYTSQFGLLGRTPKPKGITQRDIDLVGDLPTFGSEQFPASNVIGKKVTPFPADLMRGGTFFRGIDGAEIEPVPLQGGSDFPLMRSSLDKGLAFANLGKGQATSQFNRGADYAVVTAMNPETIGKLPSQVSNKTMRKILGQQTKSFIDQGYIKPEDVVKLDNLVRSIGQTKKGAEKLQDFVGFNSPDLDKYLDSLDFETANNFAQALNTRRARDLGTPNLNRILQETINPNEAGARSMDSLILLELDKTKSPVKTTDIGGVPHISYDYSLFGKPVAKFDMPVPAEVMFPEFFGARRSANKPTRSDARAFTMANVVQEITPEIAQGMSAKRIGNINSARHAQLITDTVNSNWRSTLTPVNQGGLKPIEIVDGLEDNILSESLTKYSLKEIQDGAKDGSLVFYGLGDAKTGGKVYYGLKKNTDYEADYGFTHPALTKNEVGIVGVMNNELGYASKGVSVPSSILNGIENGATVLDAYAVPSKSHPKGFLPNYYSEFGFNELGRVKFDPKYVRDAEFGGSEQKYKRLVAQWKKSGWDESLGFPDLVIMKWQGNDAIRPNATRRFLEEGSQGFRNRITRRTVRTARNQSGQSVAGSTGRTQQSGLLSDTIGNQGQVRSSNTTPISEGFRRNIQSLTEATPQQLRGYGLLT